MQAKKHKLLLPWPRFSKEKGKAGGRGGERSGNAERNCASGSPPAEVKGAFCLSENQMIYYRK